MEAHNQPLQTAEEPDNVALVQFVSVRDDTRFHESDEAEDRFIVDDFCAGLLLRVEVTDVVPGTLTPGGDPATLVLLKSSFLGFTSQRRFREVELIINFFDAQSSPYHDPEVVDLWPDGEYTYRSSERQVENTINASAMAGGSFAGASTSVGMLWERTTSTTQEDAALMTGATWRGPRSGRRNGVRLFLSENASQPTGIVTEVHSSVLLRQKKQDRQLTAEVKVTAQGGQRFRAEWLYRRLSGTRTISAPAFTPRKTSKSAKVNNNFLDNEDLTALSGIPPKQTIADV
ncbi:hypothetical protein GLAREA_08518 [Glarea lozoyensis ATCC 20868]|uniref:Uncharacterized protein n=2 Tax=Glarea lozoyensis TaxID=101852 RepID=S3CFC1_GLAL2|nr:uncharacterized protein GLAREA_08518 [Glarea lozoyensis ATCC 20868]EHL02278.1 hypothetical protein M7I_1708 [Glarea lozoyensis 74030]EPE24665.1 hypothetical protein GLAREA_08518 [Glarea lozoyensis ATCC 20868]